MPDFRGNFPITHPGHSNLGPNGAFEEEDAEMPWVGVASTVPDLFRFAEMLRQARRARRRADPLAGHASKLATRNWTGEKPNELYKTLFRAARLAAGAGVPGPGIRAARHGDVSSPVRYSDLPGTFGNYGAGSALYWVDPVRELTFVCLSAGVMNSLDNIERFQRLSDIAVSAAL